MEWTEAQLQSLNLRNVVLVRWDGAIVGGARVVAGYDVASHSLPAPLSTTLWQYCASEADITHLKSVMADAMFSAPKPYFRVGGVTSGARILYRVTWLTQIKWFQVATFDLPSEHDLTTRQLQIVVLLVADKTYPEIARELCISESSVQTHVQKIRLKAGVETTHGLTAWAVRNGIA